MRGVEGTSKGNSDFREFIEKVRDGTDIVEVIGRHVTLDQNLKALCPFHEEMNPSFSVSRERRCWRCFGCGVGGDVFKFFEIYEKKSFMTVLAGFARQAGISMPQIADAEADRVTHKRLIEDILSETAEYYHRRLSQKARDYLIKERGLGEDTISRFQIGYAHGGLSSHLTSKCSFALEACIAAGVLRKTSGGEVKDHFYNHIILPNSKTGRVVHLSGRCLGEAGPKYLHLPGEIHHLYNEDALTAGEVCITEGIIDCLSALEMGFAAVATQGTAGFKPEYVQKLSRCERVYICFDGDKEGREGALTTAKLVGNRARILQLPDGYDLNDYSRDNTEVDFRGLIAAAKDLIQVEISVIPADTCRIELPEKLDPIIRQLAGLDAARSEAYLTEMKQHFSLKKTEVDAYRSVIKGCRKEADSLEASQHASSASSKNYTASFPGLVDLVEHDGRSAFLVKLDDGLQILPQIERDGVICHPPPIRQIPWLLPRGSEVISLWEIEEVLTPKERDGVLYQDILDYVKNVSELPGEGYYDLVVAWIMHTYLPDTVQYSPIICLFAVPERGKTRTGKGMIYLAYRGIHVESLREAYIFRVSNDLNAALFFDVMNLWRKATKSRSEDILLQRFEKGMTVPRVLNPDRGAHMDITYYDIFGPTIIATNEAVHTILDTRAITINMPPSTRTFQADITPEATLELKERLVAFRARHLDEELPDMAKPNAGRLGDISRPLLQVLHMVRPDRVSSLRTLLDEIERRRSMEKAESLEAEILKTVIGCEDQVTRGILSNKTITDSINAGKPEKEQLTYTRIGKRLSAMGFDKTSTSTGAAAITWNRTLIERLMRNYGLSRPSEPSDASGKQGCQPGDTDGSGGTDGYRSLLQEGIP